MTRTFRYQQIAAALRADIADGAFTTGILPSEAELSASHGASRVTVRRALEALRDDGLIDSRQGLGWFVGGSRITQSLDSFGTIEQQLVAAGRVSERRVLGFGFVAAPPEIAMALGDEVLEVSRLQLADGSPFALITVWCAAAVGSGFSRRDVERTTFIDLLGHRLGEARQVISATVAGPRVASLLAIDAGQVLLRVRRTTSDRRGAPLLVSEHLYPADQTEFEVTLHQAGTGSAALRLVEGQSTST